MEWIVTAVFVGVMLLVIARVAYVLLFPAVPTTALIGEIKDAIRRLQLAAADEIGESRTDGTLPGVSSAAAEQQTAPVGEVVRFVYTIDREDEAFVHLISSQLLAKRPEKFQVQCMLIVILLLSQQMENADLDPKQANFEIDRSELGTHFVGMRLTPERHAALMKAEPTVPEARPVA